MEFSLSKVSVHHSTIIFMMQWRWRNMKEVNREPLLMSCVAAISGIMNYCALHKYELPDDKYSV